MDIKSRSLCDIAEEVANHFSSPDGGGHNGWGTVQDTGGDIKGNRLDVWFESVEEARQWGRRHLNVTVCK